MKAIKWEDKPISVPGLYVNLPIEEYHQGCTAEPGISSSGLRLLDKKTPLHYYDTSYLNPDRFKQPVKDHFEFGRACHALLLGEEFAGKYIVRPDKWDDWRTKDAKEWRGEKQALGLGILTPDQYGALVSICKMLESQPQVMAGCLQGHVEHSILWRDHITGVWLKSRPDILPVADAMAVDIKTTTDASPEAVQKACTEYGYPIQGALMEMGMKAVLNIAMTDFWICWIEKQRPYAVNFTPVDREWIHWSKRELRRAIDTFARCVENNEWPGYEQERTIYIPDWRRKQLERQEQLGLLPEIVA